MSQRVKRALLTALAEEEGIVNIIDYAMQRSKSIKDIMMENNDNSHISDYRKIKWLLNEGLLVIDKIIITSGGKKFSLYHSTLKAINVRCEDNDVFVELSLSKILTLQRSG